MQTGCHGAYVGSRLKRLRPPGRRHLKSQPSSRIGENPPYGMIGGIEETSASFEARSAPRSYPTRSQPRKEARASPPYVLRVVLVIPLTKPPRLPNRCFANSLCNLRIRHDSATKVS